jgi:adenylate kinase family enzyme
MQRLLVVGPVAAGKTRLARTVAEKTRIPGFELDSIRFDDRWNQRPENEFRSLVERIADEPLWIIDGNYASVRDVVWRRADTVAWLDYSLPVVLRQLSFRTIRRIFSREDLGNGRRESLRRLFSPQSIFVWAFRSHDALRAEYERASDIYGAGCNVIRLHSPHETEEWLASMDARPPGS